MTKFKELNSKTKLSETQYYSFVKTQGDKVQLVNDYGENIVVDKNYVEKCLVSSDQVESTKTMNKTEVAAIFIANPSVVMTVNFNKQVKEADVVAEIKAAVEGSSIKEIEAAIKKGVKKAISGEERIMVGRHEGIQDSYGRIQFWDMEIEKDLSKDYDNRMRLVDTRTLNWIIVKGTKYLVK